MVFKKMIVVFSIPLFLSSLLLSQSLVELAKKEQERRRGLRSQKVNVITNSDLKKMKRRAALAISAPFLPAEEIPPEESTPSEGFRLPPHLAGMQQEIDVDKTIVDLEQKWNSQKEYISLLTTRMNGLWQEYYSMDDMSDRGGILKEITETSQKLEQAEQDEAKTREALEKFRSQVKK